MTTARLAVDPPDLRGLPAATGSLLGRDFSVAGQSPVLHADRGLPLMVGDNVTIGHQVMLHGCTIGDGALIGIQAIVLNGATIGRDCIVAAGAVVTERKSFADGSLIVGAPARAIRKLTPQQLEYARTGALHYVDNAWRFSTQLRKIR